jgi:hypothetical protein
MTACTKEQVANIDKDGNYGLFTWSLVNTIQEARKSDFNMDKKVTFNELYDTMIGEGSGVPQKARELGLSKPKPERLEQYPTIIGQRKNEIFLHIP